MTTTMIATMVLCFALSVSVAVSIGLEHRQYQVAPQLRVAFFLTIAIAIIFC